MYSNQPVLEIGTPPVPNPNIQIVSPTPQQRTTQPQTCPMTRHTIPNLTTRPGGVKPRKRTTNPPYPDESGHHLPTYNHDLFLSSDNQLLASSQWEENPKTLTNSNKLFQIMHSPTDRTNERTNERPGHHSLLSNPRGDSPRAEFRAA